VQRTYDPSSSNFRSRAELDAWLGDDHEQVLEPDLPIIDTHHHLWRREQGEYLRDELFADLGSGHAVKATVFIECGSGYRTEGPDAFKPVGETEFVVRTIPTGLDGPSGGQGICAGIVGHVDFRLGDVVKPVLEAHIAAGDGRFRGIRHSLRWDAAGIAMFGRPFPKGLALDDNFRRGFRHLAPLDLSFDAWTFFHQLDELADLAGTFPDTAIIVNHVGGPLGVGPYSGRRDAVFAEWRKGLAAVAAHPNTSIKLGGLGMLYYGFDFYKGEHGPGSAELAAAWKPYIETCIELFGPERALFESNFPVDRQSCSYRVIWNAFKSVTADYSAEEKRQLYSATAARVYRIAL